MGTKNKKTEDKCLAAGQTLSILFNTRIKELPEDFYTSVKIGDYYMYVYTICRLFYMLRRRMAAVGGLP